MKKLLSQVYPRQQGGDKTEKQAQQKSKALRRIFRRLKGTSIDTRPFPFLSLPREIRDIIYRELLTTPANGTLWIRYNVSLPGSSARCGNCTRCTSSSARAAPGM
ncbi:hypothetical protein BO70DRAFT_361391 [Aspergillus heteromorphus CBS 117.55]|uniref:Uncharacterized protein n=1 Tax=Aspergillus heteromorphus CBS 117.55 TaxID=1448321 RepID=A0A317WIK9_9EURO|nr:uncharacterized protein BO70DRAFT_361391 [Aspergillus heteromorphus CBS 117.55]PWY85007.1 hypothetical protein BO70DRAFT_361391 [Aspergillus heteromorphus CBS 117.55]